MTDLRRNARRILKRRRARRRNATPLVVSAAVAVGSVGALAWVAPRVQARSAGSSTRPAESAYLAGESAALEELAAIVAAQQGEVASLASQPAILVPGPTPAAPAQLPSLPSISLPPSPVVHATTGASGVP